MGATLGLSAAPWSAAPDQTTDVLWQILGYGGPAVVGIVLLVTILRALFRQRRYRALGVFGEAGQRAVREALAEAESCTVGEILPVVVERSDPHPAAEWLAGVSFLLVGSALLAPWLPWGHPVIVLLAQLALGAMGFLLARWLPDFKRMFVFEDRASEVAEEQAFQEFYRNGLHETRGATGILLFVSLFEHRSIVLADEGIDAKVSAEYWADTNDAILDGIRRGALEDGLIAGIRRTGELLAESFPRQPDSTDEIPNRLIVRRQ